MTERESESKYTKEYEERFAWRKERQIYNLKDLSEVAGDWESIKSLRGLFGSLVSNDPKDALRWSILNLWLEARECYIFGEFQSCILTCGALVERCLKLEYEIAKGSLPRGARWTLGVCINKCKGVVEPEVLALANQMLTPRNSRAHALLEHADPQLAILGGAEPGIEVRSSLHRLIEPYRGEATRVVKITSEILSKLYSQNQS